MTEIIHNKHAPLYVPVYRPDDSLLGYCNEYEFDDVRCQIMHAQIDGFYVIFNNQRISVYPNGRCDCWPSGFFDLKDKFLEALLGWGMVYDA